MPTPQFITDNNGKKLAVVLPIKEYNKLIEELEDLEDVKEFDKAMKKNKRKEAMPLDDYLKTKKAKKQLTK
jgi:PHD/YefM family antitoxin component YafN of YafNO toxin-antitoxin module